MHVDFECSGGFANLQLSYHADTDTIPESQAEELLKLLEGSGVLDLQQSDLVPSAPSGAPDMFSYTLSLSEGGKRKTLTFNDLTAPSSLQPLLGYLRKLSIEQKLRGT